MKNLITWSENHPTRARRIMLFSVIFSYILLTFICMLCVALDKDMHGFLSFYVSYSAVASVCIGFYTGTKPSGITKEIKESIKK